MAAGAIRRGRDLAPPERFLLGASLQSAAEAADLGWGFVYAGHQQGDPLATATALESYREKGGKSPILALAAFAAASRSEAQERVEALEIRHLVFADGHSVNLTSEAAAHDYARQYGSADYIIERRRPKVFAGTGEDIRAALAALVDELGVEEFILDLPPTEPQARLAAIALMAKPSRRAVA